MSQRRDRSLRAQARAILKQERAVLPAPSTPPHLAAPSLVFELQTASPQPSLTERARVLYEDSVVPVRDIARLCGVSERTIYKYAHRQNWKPRYRWAAHDLAKWRPGWSEAPEESGEAGTHHRGWQPEPAFAPAKGAGARFIKREDAGAPFATGLMANDPAGAARASSDCEATQASSARAEQEAALLREMDRREKTCADATSVLRAALALAGELEGEGRSAPYGRTAQAHARRLRARRVAAVGNGA